MRLTAWEEERLLIFTAAELARRHRERGLALNAPEAISLICDAMLEAARAGSSYAEVEAAGRSAVRPEDVLDGVREIVDEVRLEVLLDDGTRLIHLLDPIGGPGAVATGSTPPSGTGPGAVVAGEDDTPDPTAGRPRLELDVTNTSRRIVRVSSHFPFDRVNQRLVFDRAAAVGFRLDLPAGASERWGPGEHRTVRLVRYAVEGPRP